MNANGSSDQSRVLPILTDIVTRLVDSCIMDDILIMHRAIKLGYFHVIAPESVTDSDGSEPVGGSVRAGPCSNAATIARDNSSKAANCRCVKCHSKVAATRFAHHLSNCMGLGRNSSRRANKRIAEQQRLEDYDDDAEEDFIQDTLSYTNSMHTSASDSALSRVVANTINKQQQHSPLKMTISLVPNKTTDSAVSKHVVRSLNGAPVCNLAHLSCPSAAVRNGATPKPMAADESPIVGDPLVVLKGAAVTFAPHDVPYSVLKRE